jgi:pimeloyl-ACP methyl ester carboxylesterase
MMSQTLPLSDGTSARILTTGQGAPVLLIHGVGLRAEAWGPQIAALSPSARVIAVDMPGHGDSDPLPGTPDLPDYVAWAARVVQALALGPVSLAGHSMGALIAGGLAVERPDLVARVALLNGVFRRDAQAKTAVLARAAELAAGPASVDGPLARWFGPGEEGPRDTVAAWLRAVSPAGYAAAYRAFAGGDATYADRYHTLRMPFLALTGDGDANSSPDMARAMAAAVPGGRAVILQGHRHMANLTAPEAVSNALLDWLATERQPA